MTAGLVTTQWNQILAARDGSETEARAALEALCQTYWQPIYAYIRHQGSSPDEARDLTQGFFAEFLEKDLIRSVDPERGRFRSFLLASLRHYLSHERTHARALKRGGGTRTLSLDVEAGEAGYARRPAEEMTPVDVFERRWAMTVLDQAMRRLQEESEATDSDSQFEKLKSYLTGSEPRAPYRETSNALGISEGAVATAVHRLRQRYGQYLRSEIAETVVDQADVDDELRNMLTLVQS